MGKLRRVKADAVMIDGIIVDDDDAVQKSRAHFMLVVLRSSERMQSGEDGCFQLYLLSVLAEAEADDVNDAE